MPYPLRRNQRTNSEYMTPEESQLWEALRHFCFEPEQTSITDFCPTDVLYQTYRAFMVQGGFAEILNQTEFGVALRRVFDIEPERKTRRICQGVHTWGYYHVRGPGSVVTHNGPGNPRLQHARPQTTANVPPAPDTFNDRLAAARAAAVEEE